MIYVFLLITLLSFIFAFRKKKPLFLSVPFATIFVYLMVQVALVPLPFWDTVKFIFSLR